MHHHKKNELLYTSVWKVAYLADTKILGQNLQNACGKCDVGPVTQTGFICPIIDMDFTSLFTFG